MCSSPVLPILYNAVQCLLIRYHLLRFLPAAASAFFSLHPDPVAGTVICSFRKPTFEFHDVLDGLKRGRAQVNIQSLPYVERQGLGASWMRLIHAIGLESQRKKQFQRIVVNSSLDVNPPAMNCSWKSFVFLALGLGVDPMDPVFHGLGGRKDAVSEQSLQSTVLRSETEQRLVEIRWHEGAPCLELTEHCSSWSVRRSLAQFLHMVSVREGRKEVLHFVPVTGEKGQTPTAEICDCKETNLNTVEFSTLRNIHYAITWTLYFEELLHQIPCEIIPIPQSLLLLQFEITEELHQIPTERLQYQISSIFPSDTNLVANIMSALTSIWNSSEHQTLLSRLSGTAHKSPLENFRRPASNTTAPSTRIQSNDQSPDIERTLRASGDMSSLYISDEPNFKPNNNDIAFDLYPTLHSSPTFRSLSQTYSPSALISLTKNNNSPPSHAPGSAITININLDDKDTPEWLLARLIIALSAMRGSTAPRGWVTSIASGAPKFKVGPDAGEDMGRKLLGYRGGGMLRME